MNFLMIKTMVSVDLSSTGVRSTIPICLSLITKSSLWSLHPISMALPMSTKSKVIRSPNFDNFLLIPLPCLEMSHPCPYAWVTSHDRGCYIDASWDGRKRRASASLLRVLGLAYLYSPRSTSTSDQAVMILNRFIRLLPSWLFLSAKRFDIVE